MRIVLQDVRSGLYLGEAGLWTADLRDAWDFKSSNRAIRFVEQHRYNGLRVLVAFVEAAFIDMVPLHVPGWPALSQAA